MHILEKSIKETTKIKREFMNPVEQKLHKLLRKKKLRVVKTKINVGLYDIYDFALPYAGILISIDYHGAESFIDSHRPFSFTHLIISSNDIFYHQDKIQELVLGFDYNWGTRIEFYILRGHIVKRQLGRTS